MKKGIIKILSIILTLLVLISSLPIFSITSFAAGTAYNSDYVGGPAGDGKGIIAHGIDISKWQEDRIDFAKLKADNTDFVIIRAGYRNTADSYFEYNYKAAKAAGLDVGIYWYSYAVTAAEATQEAATCASVISGKKFEYPIYFDFEDSTQMSLSTSLKKSICRTWLNYMAGKGYLVGLYSMYSQLTAELNPNTITPEYECWMARYFNSGTYSSYADYHSKYGMWQYTDSGKKSGYSGNLDCNVCFKDYPAIVKKYGFNNYAPEKQTYTLKFDANGGVGTMADQTMIYGVDTAINANKFTKEGYEFKGWYAYRTTTNQWRYKDANGNAGWYEKGSQPTGYFRSRYSDKKVISKTGLGTGDIVKLTAAWGKNTYKVKYEANGGKGTMGQSTHVYGIEKALTANAFTKSNHTFAGWMLTRSSDGKTAYKLEEGGSVKWYVAGSQPDGYRLALYSDMQVVTKLSSSADDVITATAQWQPNTTGTKTFYIDYNANGGEGTMERTTVVKGTKTATSKCTFTKPGYKFAGWRVHRKADDTWSLQDKDGNAKWCKYTERPEGYDDFHIYKNGASVANTSGTDCDIVTFYAVWEEDFKFTFVFDANGGEGTMPNQTVAYGVNTKINANQFTKAGYKFVGWNLYKKSADGWYYTNGTDSGYYAKDKQPSGYYLGIYEDQKTVAKTGSKYDDVVTLYAVWSTSTYTVQYMANGAEGTMKESTHAYGVEKAILKNGFTKAGNTFAGWTLSRKSDDKMAYTLAEGGSVKWYAAGSQPDGYRLALYRDMQVVSKLSSSADDVITVTAQWTPNTTGTKTFYIDYNANGGTGTMKRTTVVKGNSTATSECTFTKPGYKFAGWRAYRKSDDAWRMKDANGNVVWCNYNEKPTGYDEFSLYKNGGNVANTSSVDCDIVTFYAVWEEDFKFTFVFDANGGEGTMPNQTVVYGVDTKINANQFTKAGYKFAGWNLYKKSADGWYYTNGTDSGYYAKGKQPSGYYLGIYEDQKTVSKTGSKYDDVVTLYAVWEKDLIIGDANQDGRVSIEDATLIQLNIVNDVKLSGDMFTICDANADGSIDIKDVTMIQRYIVELVSSLG